MRHRVEDSGTTLSVRGNTADAIVQCQRLSSTIRERLGAGQPPLHSQIERDIVMLAIAQKLGVVLLQ